MNAWKWKMCLNWKVIAGVAVATAGLFVFAPELAAAALPFLVLAICPLSMIAMAAMMNGGKGKSETACSAGSANAGPSRPGGTPVAQLASLEAQQQDLARQIAALESEASRTPGTPDSRRGEAPATARL